MRHLSFVLLFTLAACGSKQSTGPANPEPSGDGPATTEPAATPQVAVNPGTPIPVTCTADDAKESCDSLKLIADLAGVIDANKGDCKRLAAAVNGWWDKNKDAVAAGKAYNDGLSDADKEALQKRHEDEFVKIIGAIMGGVGECQEDPEFQEAIKNVNM